jgi:hypothetical protein
MKMKDPPKVLVETWLHLLKQKDDKELQEHGKNMLLSTFENMQMVTEYAERHNLQGA